MLLSLLLLLLLLLLSLPLLSTGDSWTLGAGFSGAGVTFSSAFTPRTLAAHDPGGGTEDCWVAGGGGGGVPTVTGAASTAASVLGDLSACCAGSTDDDDGGGTGVLRFVFGAAPVPMLGGGVGGGGGVGVLLCALLEVMEAQELAGALGRVVAGDACGPASVDLAAFFGRADVEGAAAGGGGGDASLVVVGGSGGEVVAFGVEEGGLEAADGLGGFDTTFVQAAAPCCLPVTTATPPPPAPHTGPPGALALAALLALLITFSALLIPLVLTSEVEVTGALSQAVLVLGRGLEGVGVGALFQGWAGSHVLARALILGAGPTSLVTVRLFAEPPQALSFAGTILLYNCLK